MTYVVRYDDDCDQPVASTRWTSRPANGPASLFASCPTWPMRSQASDGSRWAAPAIRGFAFPKFPSAAGVARFSPWPLYRAASFEAPAGGPVVAERSVSGCAATAT